MPARRLVPETFIAAFAAAAAAVMASGYLLDAIGLPIHPAVLALVAIAAGGMALAVFRDDASACPLPSTSSGSSRASSRDEREDASRAACHDPSTGSGTSRASSRDEQATASRGTPPAALALFAAVAAGSFGYFLWLASPSLLPVTNGPDIVHHLQLIHVIHRTHRLVHDAALEPYLLEMMNYTPGSHIAAAVTAAWLRVDPLRVLLPLTALFVAIKVGSVYALAVRLLAAKRGAPLLALAAPALLAMPVPYVLGSFFQFFYYAQVLSETFAIGMAIAAVGFVRTGARRHLWLASICAVGVFLSWPMWLIPAGAAVLAAVVARAACPPRSSPMSGGRTGARRARESIGGAAVLTVPVALLGILHASTHPAAAAIIGSSGAVTKPSAETLGVAFVALGVVGMILVFRPARFHPERASASRGGRPIAVLFAATILQALALAAFDARAGSRSFYLPFKMVYLAVLPCAVLGALALSTAADTIASRLPRARTAAMALPLVLALVLAAGRLPAKRPRSPISASALAAGLWARDAVPAACVDYFSAHWLTGYWLHLDVLGNPRLSDRMRAETFDFPDVVGKWIQGKGLPYAIVEDFAAVPRDAREDMVVLRQFGRAAVVQNTRPGASCRGLTPK